MHLAQWLLIASAALLGCFSGVLGRLAFQALLDRKANRIDRKVEQRLEEAYRRNALAALAADMELVVQQRAREEIGDRGEVEREGSPREVRE